jgi:hypothetical protein
MYPMFCHIHVIGKKRSHFYQILWSYIVVTEVDVKFTTLHLHLKFAINKLQKKNACLGVPTDMYFNLYFLGVNKCLDIKEVMYRLMILF